MADQITDTTALSNLVPTYYSKRLLERMEPNCRAYQLAEKRSIPKNAGKSILWNRYVQLAEGISLTEGTVPSASMMSTVIVSAQLTQLGNLVRTTDLLEGTGISDVVRDAVDVLGDNAALTVDKYILNQIGFYGSALGALSAQSAAFYTKGFPILFSKTSGNLDGIVGGSGAAVYLNASATVSLPMSVSAIRGAVTHLRSLNVSPFEDGYYHAIIHPTAIYLLRSDPVWGTWNQYTRPEKMERGLVGEVEGVKFYDDPNLSTSNFSAMNISTTIGSSHGTVYGTLIFGRGAYAVSELEGFGTGDNATKVYVTPRSTQDKADPLQQYSYIGYKSTLAACILNVSAGCILKTNSTQTVI